MHYIKDIITVLFEMAMFINAMLFVPQIMKIINFKTVKGLSFFTFIGFNIIQVVEGLQGYFLHDYQLMFGMLLSFITCGVVTSLIIYYRYFVGEKD